MGYYSNAQLVRGMDNMYRIERQARKKLEYAMAALKTIAEAGPEIDRDQLIETAQANLSELATRKDW